MTFRYLFKAGVRNLGWRRALLGVPRLALWRIQFAWLNFKMRRNMASADWPRVGVPVAWTADVALPGTEQNETKSA